MSGTHTTGDPISPVTVGTNVIFVGESCHPGNTVCGIATFTLGSGSGGFVKQVAWDSLKDSSGNQYETFNTPAVDNTHTPARVYLSASTQCSSFCGLDTPRQGAIIAYDINTDGSIHGGPFFLYYFPGPSGSSPALVQNFTASAGTASGSTGNALFFDGLPHAASAPPSTSTACEPNSGGAGFTHGAYFSGCFYGLIDTTIGTSSTPSAQKMWANIYAGDQFQAGAVYDPRQQIWIFPINVTSNINATCTSLSSADDNCLIGLNTHTGALTVGPIDLTPVIEGLDNAAAVTDSSQDPIAADLYTPSTPPILSSASISGTTKYFVTAGVNDRGRTNPRVVNLDVTAYYPGASSASPVGNWVTPVGGDFGGSGTYGQFGTLIFTDGGGSPHNMTVFGGFTFGPYVYGY